MGFFLLLLQVFLCSIAQLAGHESLLIIGGSYPDGSEMNEVEVWSPSPECAINIKTCPVSGHPGVAFLDGNLYACGGLDTGNVTSMNTCYVYNIDDDEWREGPALKFTETPTSSSPAVQLWLATVGMTVTAVWRQNIGSMVYISTLVNNEWSEPIAVDGARCDLLMNIVALDEKHVALLDISPFDLPFHQYVEVINVETATRVTDVYMEWECLNAFLYNGQFTCLKREDSVSELWSLTFDEDFGDPTWSLVYDLPDDIFDTNGNMFYSQLTMVEGMLTAARPKEAAIFYLEEDQWRTDELEPREGSAFVVLPCNM